ncbi:enoyl-CoA hydratase/isomerase family protein [Salinibacterium sp. ZJ450]|uniref:enoyl-CoA hydratase/isomerase family protein n=1 Tax=Salinibacterium sp. ZJ450 TaxID=2708338 RepID=UPI00141E7749|nr:enoyl-CoA hydratase/isomerase family protein [Salinibacterium sp. ZJ450]
MTVATAQSGRVMTITLSRAEKRNAISREMAGAIRAAILEAESDAGCGCVLITSDSVNFSAGADLATARRDRQRGVLERHTSPQPVFDLIAAIARSKTPVISTVTGHCLGGGVGIAAASALVVADQTAQFGLPEAELGIFPAALAPYVAARIGVQRTFTWGLLGGVIEADRAYDWGLADLVVDADAADTARRVAERLAEPENARLTAAAMEWREHNRDQSQFQSTETVGRLLSMVYGDTHDAKVDNPHKWR